MEDEATVGGNNLLSSVAGFRSRRSNFSQRQKYPKPLMQGIVTGVEGVFHGGYK